MNWPVTSKLWSICVEKGNSGDPSKSLFRNNFQKMNPTKATNSIPTYIECSIVDAEKLTHMLPISYLRDNTLFAWAERLGGYIKALLGNTVHIIFDNYDFPPNVLVPSKGRVQRGCSREYKPFESVLPRLSERADFLTVDSNKSELTHLSVDYFISSNITEKFFYVTEGNECFHVPEHMDGPGISTEVENLYSLQREAGTHIALHAVYALASHGGVCVAADDTDVFILLLLAGGCTTNLYFRQGTHFSKEGITNHNVTSLYNLLGTIICKVLPGFHALTGCDYTKPFFGRSKYGIFKKMYQKSLSRNLLQSLSMKFVIERFCPNISLFHRSMFI